MAMFIFQQLQQDYDRRFLSAGGHGLVINMDDLPADHATKAARALAHVIKAAMAEQGLCGIEDIIPGLTNLLVQYNPLVTTAANLKQSIRPMLAELSDDVGAVRHIRMPCCYGGEFGPDLDEMANTLGMSADAIIAKHHANTLEVAIMGFLPGLAYMKGVDEALYLPRRKTPRARVPALSVAIAMDQTVIYPLPSPGGWHIIGRIPVELFDANKDEPVLLKSGDKITFYPIDNNEYNEIKSDYKLGRFLIEIST
jgi:KipI family sensor histidine kinase inhibitor